MVCILINKCRKKQGIHFKLNIILPKPQSLICLPTKIHTNSHVSPTPSQSSPLFKCSSDACS